MANAMTGTIVVEVELKASADKFWAAIRDSANIFPKAFPEQYKSIQVIEGDGKAVGSVRLVKYAEGIPFVTTSKEKIEEVDVENKTVSYSVIDGELLEILKKFKAKLVVSANCKGEGSLVKWSLEYEKAKEEVPDPDLLTEFATTNFKDLDAYLCDPANA
ncbi:hypothetical protein V2J09_003739 [Rumex salicifolius]